MATAIMTVSAGASGSALQAAEQSAKSGARACVTKAGVATGITRGFAEYEALLIIRQVTGNWPVASDAIGPPAYTCASIGLFWECRATATVCKR